MRHYLGVTAVLAAMAPTLAGCSTPTSGSYAGQVPDRYTVSPLQLDLTVGGTAPVTVTAYEGAATVNPDGILARHPELRWETGHASDSGAVAECDSVTMSSTAWQYWIRGRVAGTATLSVRFVRTTCVCRDGWWSDCECTKFLALPVGAPVTVRVGAD